MSDNHISLDMQHAIHFLPLSISLPSTKAQQLAPEIWTWPERNVMDILFSKQIDQGQCWPAISVGQPNHINTTKMSIIKTQKCDLCIAEPISEFHNIWQITYSETGKDGLMSVTANFTLYHLEEAKNTDIFSSLTMSVCQHASYLVLQQAMSMLICKERNPSLKSSYKTYCKWYTTSLHIYHIDSSTATCIFFSHRLSEYVILCKLYKIHRQ